MFDLAADHSRHFAGRHAINRERHGGRNLELNATRGIRWDCKLVLRLGCVAPPVAFDRARADTYRVSHPGEIGDDLGAQQRLPRSRPRIIHIGLESLKDDSSAHFFAFKVV